MGDTSLAGEFYFNRSVALKVDRYSATALRDKLFVLEENKKSHKLIADLKSRDFGTQNAAIDHFDSDNFARVAKDTLFAIGHKMYQAADDNAFAAKDFIRDFPQLAQRLPEEKWRALLDGMLFEVFFDANGDLRTNFRAHYFEDMFRLQEFVSLNDSFDFIANCLRQYPGSFHVIPGTNQKVCIDVVLKRKGDCLALREVRLGGKNILRVEDEGGEEIASEDMRGSLKERDRVETELAVALGIPKRLLKISYPGIRSLPAEISVPWGWSVAPKTAGNYVGGSATVRWADADHAAGRPRDRQPHRLQDSLCEVEEMDDQVFKSNDIQFAEGSQYHTHSQECSRSQRRFLGFFSHFPDTSWKSLKTVPEPSKLIWTAMRMITFFIMHNISNEWKCFLGD